MAGHRMPPLPPSPGTPGEGRGGGLSDSPIRNPQSAIRNPHPSPPPDYRNVFSLRGNSMFPADAHAIDDELSDRPQRHAARAADEVGQRLQAAAEAAGVAVVAFDLPAQRVE